MVRPDSRLGRIVIAARRRRPLLRVTASPWWASVLIAAGARPAPASDTMVVSFTEAAHGAADDPVPPVSLDAAESALDRALGKLDSALRERALTHRSYAAEQGGQRGNERLEFLGDGVLTLVVTEVLYQRYPYLSEGELAKRRAAVINMRALADVARELHLGEHVRLGRGEEATGGRDKSSILADTLEALIGAVYLDRGLDAATDFIHRLLGRLIEDTALGRIGGTPAGASLGTLTGPEKAAGQKLPLRVHDRVVTDEIELYAEILSAAAAHDRPLTTEEIDSALGIRPEGGRSRTPAGDAATRTVAGEEAIRPREPGGGTSTS